MTSIRKASINDLKNIVPLFDKYRVFYEKETDVISAEKFLSERLQHNDSVIYVAEEETGYLTGFVQLYPIFSSTKMKRLWLLNDLFVGEQYRGKGISKQLIQAAKELCLHSNACGLMLETAKTNSIGNTLYPATGFMLDKEHYYYYWNP